MKEKELNEFMDFLCKKNALKIPYSQFLIVEEYLADCKPSDNSSSKKDCTYCNRRFSCDTQKEHQWKGCKNGLWSSPS